MSKSYHCARNETIVFFHQSVVIKYLIEIYCPGTISFFLCNHICIRNMIYLTLDFLYIVDLTTLHDTTLTGNSWGFLFLLYLYIQLSRGVVVGVLYPLLCRFGYGLDWKESIILVWCGLRGAVALALSLSVKVNFQEHCQILFLSLKFMHNVFSSHIDSVPTYLMHSFDSAIKRKFTYQQGDWNIGKLFLRWY